jgi:SAM-dependent methyltransferase
VLEFTGERIVPQSDHCEPNFASRMMHEHLVRYLFAGQLVAGKTVLDVGCGVGYGAQKLGLLGAASVTAFDISPEAVAHAAQFYAHPAVRFEVADAEKFSLDAKFDVVTCFEMIEHVQHPDRVLRCIRRHLKPDGFVIASTPRFLGEKRTPYHVREFLLEEYQALVEGFFPNTVMYLENNHFSSLITALPSSRIERVEYLKDQFTAAQADVFISVSCGPMAQQPDMQASAVIDDDSYVAMLERDVAILHKAEDDIRASLEVERAHAHEAGAFKDAEIARLIAEYNALFARAAASEVKSDEDRRAFHDERWKWQLERDQLEQARDVELRAVRERHEQDLAVLRQAETVLNAKLAENRDTKEREIARLAAQSAELARVAAIDAEIFARARSDFEARQAQDLAEIDRLTREREAFRAELAQNVALLRETEMTLADLKQQQETLQEVVEQLQVRLSDVDARRLEAYEFARLASDQAHALRREIDILKRDLVEALDFPDAVSAAPAADPRHRDIVEAMERLFLGTEATHALARNPLVARVAALAVANRTLAADIGQMRADAHEQRARAERAEAFAEDWHAQILTLRRSASWRLTKPLRWLGRLFR